MSSDTSAIIILCVFAVVSQTSFGHAIHGIVGYPGGLITNVGFGGELGPGCGPGFGPAYSSSGSGDVSVAGELGVAGSTSVMGHIPVIGSVSFRGTIPASGLVTITGSCAYPCDSNGLYN